MSEIVYTFCDICNTDHDISIERRGRGYVEASEDYAVQYLGWVDLYDLGAMCPECKEYIEKQEKLDEERKEKENAKV